MASKARIVFLIFSYFLLLPGPSYSQPAENFFQGKELKDGDELASANENFRLGFFKLSGKAYLGIWYNRNDEKPSSDANRRTPISDKSSVLTIDDYGNLKISYSGDQSIVLCLVQGASNTSAILLDTDNFRLHQIMNSDGSTKWNMRQSFDNTTDTLLPGLKLGVNNRTGRLGFFSGSGRKRYVGIWHKQADVGNAATDWKLLWVADYGRNPSTRGIWNEQDNLGSSRAAEKPVWVANWNTPVLDKSGILTIGNDGHLKILHDGGVEIVLFSATLVNNASATLLDSGNFVVHELNSDGSIKQVVGSFKLGMDPNNTKQLIIWWQGEIYWVSGLWQNSSFNLPQVLSNDVYYHFSYQSEEKEKYFKYFVYKDVISFQRLSLDTSGALWGMTTNEALKVFLKCERPSFRDGCFGRKYEECFAGKGFTAGKGIMLQSGFKFNEGDKLTLNDCKAIHTHSETDILVQGQKLRGGEHLASSGGTFRLEFFSPGSSRNRYVGISFNIADGVLLVANKKVVWVANRDNPIADKSGILMIDELGRLTISHSGGSLVVSNSVQAANNASAMLLESGNFILREQNSDGSTSQVLWQSFDHPTDTLLPGMKLGISMKTTDIWSLTWWISESNPAKGTFTLTAGFNMDDESMLVIWWKGNTYWISGNWQNGHFEFVPRLSNERDISFSYISNENEKYFTYYLNKNRTLSRYMIDFTRFKFDGNYNMSLFDCRAKCLNNCSCIAHAATDYNETSCTIWSKGVNFKESNNSYSLDVYFLVQEKGKFTSDTLNLYDDSFGTLLILHTLAHVLHIGMVVTIICFCSYVVDIGCPICNWDCSSTSFMLLIQFHSKKMQTER
ncbi:g-type lectin s-receptor-like serine/threonine-protein kinase [Quercus suber]|uniref:non-specific serine/threonine protein kinase n=1 Tax=Quercus suber TaxID=58331 RepID=A0AAW0LT29_QUESU